MKPTGYELSRCWFDWCFENPEKVSPNHTAIYFFAIEHCNRLGWKEKFGFPTQMAMEAIGIKKHQTYIKYFDDLCEWGFFKLVQRSTNQYSSNIISLLIAYPKNDKAMDKASIKHGTKQIASIGQGTGQSNSPIDKQLTINKEQSTNNKPTEIEFLNYCKSFLKNYGDYEGTLKAKYEQWVEAKWKDGYGKPIVNWKTKIKNTMPYLKPMPSKKTVNDHLKNVQENYNDIVDQWSKEHGDS